MERDSRTRDLRYSKPLIGELSEKSFLSFFRHAYSIFLKEEAEGSSKTCLI
jgi:hypothetical protein